MTVYILYRMPQPAWPTARERCRSGPGNGNAESRRFPCGRKPARLGSLRRERLWLNERRVLALELLGRAGAPALGHHLRHRVGEDLLLVVLHSVEDGAGNGLRRGLGD